MTTLDRRDFLGASLAGLGLLGTAGPLAGQWFTNGPPKDLSRPDTLFLTWQRDPTTTMTIQWIGPEKDHAGVAVHYAPFGGSDWFPLWKQARPTVTPFPTTDHKVFRVELTGLTPGTEYQFGIGGRAKPLRFRTMPARLTDAFTFVSGGDCGVNPHAVANNVVAAKQDPMFALLGGDLGYDNGRSASTSLAFQRNYSQTMIDGKGRLIPMVVCIGNHEVNGGYGKTRKEAPYFFALHDGLFADASYAALDFGDYLSLVLLDTGHAAKIEGEQTAWLDKALAARVEWPHLLVCNHVPAYPSFRAADVSDDKNTGTGSGNRKHWVPLFERYNVDIVLEHHDHTFKRTHPLKDGLRDPNGIVYLGDGSWGRLRVPKKAESRPYLATANDAYHLTVHRIEGDVRYHLAVEETGKILDVTTTRKRARR